MKETIYTIPISEIYEEECFCPFCKLYKRLEREEIRYSMGAAMMEPDYRALTNESGFCKAHMREVQSLPKALAQALVFQSHLKKLEKLLNSQLKNEKKGFGFKKEKDNAEEYIEALERVNNDCVVCNKINHHFERYVQTFIDMLKKEKDFFKKVEESDGFCLPHYEVILKEAKRKLNPKDFNEIAEMLYKIEINKFSKYQGDIDKFIESFDYHNAGKPCPVPGDTVLKTAFLLDGEFEKLPKKLEEN